MCRISATVAAMGRKAFKTGALSEAVGTVIRRNLRGTEGHLAEQIGVSPDTMTRWLNGQRSMTVDHLAAISSIIGLRPGELLRQAEDVLLEQAFRSSIVGPSADDYALAALDETTAAGTETDEGHFGA